MKKILLFAIALLSFNMIYAQERAFIVNESFNGSSMPEGWYFTGEGSENFKINTTNNAGGDPNELYLKSSPFITSGIHLVMATANLTNVEEVGISFKHYLNNDQQSSTIGIATSSDNGATWNTAWSHTYSEASSTGQYTINETVSTPDMGKNNVLFCLFFEGNTYNINKWFFDDITIFSQVSGADLQLSSIDVDALTQAGQVGVDFTVNNSGDETISSFVATYSVDGYESVTETFNANLAPSSNQQFTFSNTIGLLPGTYLLNIDIVSVNGESDAEPSNNHLSKEIKTYLKAVQRTPMIEHFSSSTCAPCVNVDNLMGQLTANNPGKYTYTKFPVNWPGIGDPYATDDCIVRSDYYEVYTVPQIAFDGQVQSSAVNQTSLDERLNVPAYIDIVGAFDIVENNTIKVIADIISYIDMPDVKVFLSVNEKTTTENVGSNGLTEFHHIFMKMLGNINGIETSFAAGHYQRFEFTYDMSDTNMEEIDDLEVAVWVQNYESKEMYNSSFLHEYSEHLYPAQNLVVEGNTVSWEAPEQGNPSGYNVYINNELSAENSTSLSYTVSETVEIVSVEVVAVYGDNVSIGITNIEHEVCDAPDNVVATAGEDDIEVSWNAVDGATEYQLYRNSALLTTVSSNTYTDSDIELGTMYCYTLRSVCGEGSYSAFSEESCAQVGEKPCNAPTNLNATVEQDVEGYEYKFKVTMTWDAVDGASGYEVYINNSWFGMTSDNFYIAGSDNEGTFDFAVTTLCASGESEMSESHTVVVQDVSLEEYESSLEIYPNPVKDILTIKANTSIKEINIYNIIGINVYKQSLTSVENCPLTVDISSYNSGIYFIKIETNEGEIIKQFIKE